MEPGFPAAGIGLAMVAAVKGYRIVLAMPEMHFYGWKIVLGLSVLTMTVGNVLALWQDNVRRLLAYSSIANAGYMPDNY